MQTARHHPIFSRLGCGSALLLALLLLAILAFRGGGPFSPGPLSANQLRQEPLGGFASHAEFEADCAHCHEPWRGISAARCTTCHESVAVEQNTGRGLHGLLGDTTDCTACHIDHQGRTAAITPLDRLDTFDHQRLTGYSLAQHPQDYAGNPLACSGCHQPGRYAAEFVNCAGCHTDADPVFMAGHIAQFGESCLDCHDGSGRLVDFDHDTVFVLDGAHTTTDCAGCHRDQVFAGTSTACVACHAEPAVHTGLFGQDCARCHTTAAWFPAELTQHTFPLDHGREINQSCETCHTAAYTTYTCYNCHEHDPQNIREEHEDEDIFDFMDCVACHPTGREEESEHD
jgi:hypothetical protein